MKNLFCNVEDNLDRENDIINTILKEIQKNNSKLVQIIDPYFRLSELKDYFIKKETKTFWERFVFELYDDEDLNILKIIIITKQPEKLNDTVKLVDDMTIVKELVSNFKRIGKNKGSINFYFNKIEITIVYYDSKAQTNKVEKPSLHDRWILFSGDIQKRGIHCGCSLSGIKNKDVTLTEFADDEVERIFHRFDELLQLEGINSDE